MTLALITVTALLLLAAFFLHTQHLTFTATQHDLHAIETSLNFERLENERLRTQHARKVDRALWMLVQVRSDRLVTKPAQLIRNEPIQITLGLQPDLVDALERSHGADAVALAQLTALLGEHLGRRLAKAATTTSLAR